MENYKPSLLENIQALFDKIDRRFWVFSHDLLAIFVAMQLASWLILKEDLALVNTHFILKQSLIFALISSGFFLWFQTYKGVWRYISWRQAALLAGALGFSSLIFFPLLTKAHMQPINIPGSLVFVNWLLASALTIGSRFFFRVFYERLLLADEVDFAADPTSRLILVGAGPETKAFINWCKRAPVPLYDILGIVDSEPSIVGSSISGVRVLGELVDLPDLIENFNAEAIHPHHIVIMDNHFYGSKGRALIENLAPFKVDFKRVHNHDLIPLSIEELFYKETDHVTHDAFAKKRVLLYGPSSSLGTEFTKRLCEIPLKKNRCAEIFLWDTSPKDLATLSRQLVPGDASFFSGSNLTDKQITAYLKKHKIDVVVNLRAFQALALESIDSSASFEAYVSENQRLATLAQKAGVENYFFITQRAPHQDLSSKLAPLATEVLKDVTTKKDQGYSVINLPYVLHKNDGFFRQNSTNSKGEAIQIPQETLSLVEPRYAAFMLERTITAYLTQKPWDPQSEFSLETLSYSYVARLFHILHRVNGAQPLYVVSTNKNKEFKLDSKAYDEMAKKIEDLEYDKALKSLEALYP